MGDRFAPALAQNEFVLKLRLHLLEPDDQPPEDAPKVERSRPAEQQDQAGGRPWSSPDGRRAVDGGIISQRQPL
jgi:hypothetical protein